MQSAFKYFFSSAFFLFVFSFGKSQNGSAALLPKDSSALFADDPIAAMLDSLIRFKFFEKEPALSYQNKHNFPSDSVPRYPDSVYASRLAQINAESPLNLGYHPSIIGYIEMYACRKRKMTERILGLAELYFPLFEEILDRNKLPLELKYLAIVESALNPLARSRAGATGLWQFMYGTGKVVGLKINSFVDERCDPYKSTEAACQYLQFLYDMFGEWEMALAAYNAGPGNVSKAIRRSGGKTTYWEIRPYLPTETQGYVPAFIAVNYVMRYYEEHNLFPVKPNMTYFDIDTVVVKQQLSFEQISKILDIPLEDIQYLNPTYRRNVIPFSEEEKCTLSLPVSKIGSFITNEKAIYEFARKDSILQAMIVKEVMKKHTVRKGENIGKIARRYGCTPEDIKSWNNLRTAKLKTGQKLIVYIPVKNNSPEEISKTKTTAADSTSIVKKTEGNHESLKVSQENKKYKYYTVQKGDSLWSIGLEHGVSIKQIKQLNSFRDVDKIMPGQKIKIPVSG